MRIAQATVKFQAGKTFTGRGNKPRQNIVFTLSDGSEATQWFDSGDARYCKLKRGQEVTLGIEGDRITLIEDEAESGEAIAPTTTPAKTEEMEYRSKLLRELNRKGAMIKSCHTQLQILFTHPDSGKVLVSEETIQKYATTLFIELCKRM